MEGPLKIDPRTDVTSAFLHMDKVEGAGFYSLLAFLSCNWEDGWSHIGMKSLTHQPQDGVMRCLCQVFPSGGILKKTII